MSLCASARDRASASDEYARLARFDALGNARCRFLRRRAHVMRMRLSAIPRPARCSGVYRHHPQSGSLSAQGKLLVAYMEAGVRASRKTWQLRRSAMSRCGVAHNPGCGAQSRMPCGESAGHSSRPVLLLKKW